MKWDFHLSLGRYLRAWLWVWGEVRGINQLGSLCISLASQFHFSLCPSPSASMDLCFGSVSQRTSGWHSCCSILTVKWSVHMLIWYFLYENKIHTQDFLLCNKYCLRKMKCAATPPSTPWSGGKDWAKRMYHFTHWSQLCPPCWEAALAAWLRCLCCAGFGHFCLRSSSLGQSWQMPYLDAFFFSPSPGSTIPYIRKPGQQKYVGQSQSLPSALQSLQQTLRVLAAGDS